MLEATGHMHEQIRKRAVGFPVSPESQFESLSTLLHLVYESEDEVEWTSGNADYVGNCGVASRRASPNPRSR